MTQEAIDQTLIEPSDSRIKYGGFWPRLGALILDGLILAPITAGIMYFNVTSWKSVPIMLISSVASLAYKPIMEFYYGATFGKMAAGLTVTNSAYGAPSLKDILLRNVFHYGPSLISLYFSIEIYSHPLFQDIDGYFDFIEFSAQFKGPEYIGYFSGLIVFIEAVMLLADDKKRTLHDRIAGTYVIEK